MAESTATVIEIQPRAVFGSEAAGRLRRQGLIPGVVYGGGKEAVSFTVERTSLDEALRHGLHRIVELRVKGGDDSSEAMVKALQTDPFNGQVLHVDMIRIERGHKVHITVPVVLTGSSAGVRQGGRLDFACRQVELEVLPQEMVERLVVDISEMEIGAHITVADLAPLLPPSGRLLDDANRVVVLVERPRAAEPEEAVAGAVAAEPAEPELIRTKGKAEEAE